MVFRITPIRPATVGFVNPDRDAAPSRNTRQDATAFSKLPENNGGNQESRPSGTRALKASLTKTVVEKTGMASLPTELHCVIAGRMTGQNAFETYKALTSIHQASNALAGQISSDKALAGHYSALKEWLPVINRMKCADIISAMAHRADRSVTVRENRTHLSLLGLLKPEKRSALADEFFQLHPFYQNNSFVSMASGVMHLDDGRRQKMVDLACNLGKSQKYEGIAGLGAVLANLNENQRSSLVNTALEEIQYSRGIGGLAAGLPSLNPELREKILDGIIGIENGRDFAEALAEIGTGLDCLSSDQQQVLLARALKLSIAEHKTEAFIGLAAGAASLSPGNKKNMVDFAIELQGADQGHLLAALGAGIGTSDIELYESLTAASFDLNDERAKAAALAGLATGFSGASVHLHERWASAVLALKQDNHMAKAIAGAGPRLAHLTPVLRTLLFETALGMTDSSNITLAMTGLAAGLPTFADNQRKKLFEIVKKLDGKDQIPLIAAMINSFEMPLPT